MVQPISKDRHEKIKELKRVESKREAESWIQEANSDQPDDLPRPEREPQEKQNLVKYTLRLHPDVIFAIERKAVADRRKEADVARDFMTKGLRAEGLEIG